MKFFTSLKGRLFLLLSVVGPGLIAANSDNDAGGISTLTVVGARYRYQLLFVLLILTLVLAVTQEIGARIGAVTGKGLGGVIREKFGVRATMLAMGVMLLANLGVTIANMAGIASALGLMGVSKFIAIPVFSVLLWLVLNRGTFDKIEKFFLGLSLLYLVYVVAAVQVKPEWGEALGALVRPDIDWSWGFLFTMMALIGTTITPWGQFFIQSYFVDKGIHIREFVYSRIEIVVGALITNGVGFFIIVTAANTLWENGIAVDGAGDAALALEPLVGHLASILFGIGLLNASLLGAFIVPLASAYAICEAFGFESGIDRTAEEAPAFYRILGGLIVISGLFVLIPGLPLFNIILLPQLLNALLLPIILIYVYKIANDRAIMGRHVNARVMNVLLGLTVVTLVIASSFVLVGSIINY